MAPKKAATKSVTRKRTTNHVNKSNTLAQEIIGYGVAVIIAMVMIYAIVGLGLSLVGIPSAYTQIPSGIASIIGGLGMGYAIATNKKVRNALTSWMNDRL